MNILYAIPWLNKSDGGIYQYSINVLRELSDLDHQFYIGWLNPSVEIQDLVKDHNNLHLLDNSYLRRNFFNRLRYYYSEIRNHLRFVRKGEFYTTREDYLFYRAIKKFKIDLIHSPTQNIYVAKPIHSIVTIHDVQELHFPQFFTSLQRLKRAYEYKKAIDMCSAVVVSYQHIKEDINRFFSKDLDSIFICPISIKHTWINDLDNSIEMPDVEKNESDYILYPAATWPHKNHLMLLKAMAILKREKDLTFRLISTGYKTDHYKNIKAEIDKLNLKYDVEFRGIVSEDELLQLYRRAKAVVIPTLYEAGSYPLMESFLIEIPVISSNVTSLPETMGNNEFLFNPEDEVEISEKMKMILYDQEYRKRNLENLRKRKEQLKKISVAETFDKIYRTITG